MNFVEKCPRCGGQIVERNIKEILSGGIHTAFVTVRAGVCLHCGERLYSPETVRQFEEIESKLERQETDEFQPIGKTFEVA